MDQLEDKMNSAINHFEKELNALRTSRANPSMLDNIFVDAYGAKTPINQLGNISIPDSSTITIQVWDTSLIKNIDSAITESNLESLLESLRDINSEQKKLRKERHKVLRLKYDHSDRGRELSRIRSIKNYHKKKEAKLKKSLTTSTNS